MQTNWERLAGRVRQRDPDLAATRRAVRVTVAACAAFFTCKYGLSDTLAATYAVFATIAFGVLSEVSGPPWVRRVYLAVLPVAAGLVVLGTLLAAHTWSAVLGMLVVGFVVAYAGVGGPRLIGLASGLQLFYILPCFPPYAPESLPARLTGLAIGVGLLVLADRVLLPAPSPPPFRLRIAETADVVARYLAAVRANPDTEQLELRAVACQAMENLRLTALPMAQRPTGPGRRDRGLTHAAGAVRIVGGRTAALDELLHLPGAPPTVLTAALLDAVRKSLAEVAAALRGTGPAPVGGPLAEAIDSYLEQRADWIGKRGATMDPPGGLRAGVAALAIAEATRALVAATRAATDAGADRTAEPPPSAWYINASTARLWWTRLLGNLTPRSVYLQNALRLALGLAVARAAVDLLALSHGLWVLLATLTLMRTSLVASGAALLPAFAGTLAGAVVGAGLLVAIGGHETVYAVLLPVVMVLAFIIGPVLGPAYGQAGFTVVVSVLFAQLAPATWELAGQRILDVIAGGLIGLVVGAAVWPRGGAGEIRRIAEQSLRATATDITATVDLVGGREQLWPATSRSTHLVLLFENTYSQYRSEPGHHDHVDWLSVLTVARRVDGDAQVLSGRYPEGRPLPWPSIAVQLDSAARDVARGYRQVADAIATRQATRPGANALLARLRGHPLEAEFGARPHAALRVLDAWGWLHILAHDLKRTEQALSPSSRRPDPWAIAAGRSDVVSDSSG